MKTIFKVLIVMLCLSSVHSFSQKKENIKVLYVGYSKDKPMPNLESISAIGGMDKERFKAEYGTRMFSFKNLLEKYFTSVTTVDAREYKEAMSKNYDVTIFDEMTTKIKDRVIKNDPVTGELISFEPTKFLSDDFNSASIFIGHTASVLGASLGSKLDWYCLCLDRHAHHTNTSHEIFKGPYKTTVTMKDMDTPYGVLEAYDGLNEPAKIPMWEVDKEGYQNGKGYRIGLVARGWGFEDAPNSEIISGGVSSKQKTAVALGRHGNFFLWGFAGSPDYMTEEAKVVFVNTVAYMYKHKNDQLIVRKYNERIATKDFADELYFYTTAKSYEFFCNAINRGNESDKKAKARVQAKKDRGEELNEEDKIISESTASPLLTREEYLKKTFERTSWGKSVGIDTLKIRNFIKENRPYFYSQPNASYDLIVDQDIKSLKTANTDSKVLDKAITLLEQGTDVQKAKRILLRYTLENFNSAKEWRSWYTKNKKDLLFTEVGGYVWINKDENKNPKTRPRNKAQIEELTKSL
ncbi:hypothetical protein [Flavobacterium sp. YO12]|uniref:hypothetical protein n=1 Tax=Flavobacterium sp. YO12 TaxID=1920029 RepID=UPI00100B8E7F|nr:hypothetical protein [Flavobacterium sp. YO12]RXM48394.1 hypothetical protein BOW55_06310 [Flavobacterium sp. YO12]